MLTPREDLSSDRILLVGPTGIRLVGMEGKPTAVVSPCTRVEFAKPGPDSSVSHARPTATPLPFQLEHRRAINNRFASNPNTQKTEHKGERGSECSRLISDPMARALSNANLVAALTDGVALLATRRGYATTAAAATTTTGTGSRERLAVAEQMVKSAPPAGAEEAACSWVPDPATGYYRPANRMDEIDPAALREMLLTRNKSRSRLI
ncbi:hypothetical protein B296_00033909 [Ensete ventricosum]|uniref:Late embryogenesis abundant protein Lea5 n=1 Tax=Ensete ventricosum TaxID=4639 RepID=A0A426ZLF1_ENSVE|nr:hypothetical protein B296_00033909 [Ensete ventricosum]